MNVTYRSAVPTDYPTIAGLMRRLYEEDPAERPVPDEHFERTFAALDGQSEKGTILVFEANRRFIGYAVLVNFWSNEYGGNVLTIDELFVAKEFRGQGVATDFIRHLIDTRLNDAVALHLEVTPANARARKLYESLGFCARKNQTMQCVLNQRL